MKDTLKTYETATRLIKIVKVNEECYEVRDNNISTYHFSYLDAAIKFEELVLKGRK